MQKNPNADLPQHQQEAIILSKIAFLEVVKMNDYKDIHFIYKNRQREYLLEPCLPFDLKVYYKSFIDDAIEEHQLQLSLLDETIVMYIARQRYSDEYVFVKTLNYNGTPKDFTNDKEDAYFFYNQDLKNIIANNTQWRYGYIFSPIK